MDVSKLYPYFKQDSRLVLEPIGGLLAMPHAPGNLRKEPKLELTPLAVEVVKHCNGLLTCGEIVAELGRTAKGKGFDVMETVSGFIAKLAEHEWICFSDEPLERPLTLVGSTKYFTPLHFSIELTDYCNLQCRHCYRNSGPGSNDFLPTEKLLSLMEVMSAGGVNSVEFTGGEPMAHPGFIELFKKANSCFERVGVISNGTLITDEIAELFAASTDKIVVQIDLDGDTAEVHDTLRGVPGAFDRVCGSAHAMRQKEAKFRVVMNVHAGNLFRVRQTAQLARDLGARQFSFATVLEVGRGGDLPVWTSDEILEFQKLVSELEAADPDFIKVSVEVPENLYYHQRGSCGAGCRSLVLGPTGLVRPCPMLGEEYGHFGNLLETDYQDLMQRAPLGLHYHVRVPDETSCEGCEHLYFCKGCFSRPFHAKANSVRKQKDFRCAWNEQTHYFEALQSCARTSDI